MGITQSARRGDGACTVIASLTVRVTVDTAVAVGHEMVSRCVSEEAAE